MSNNKGVNDTVRVGVEALSLLDTQYPFQFKTKHGSILESPLVLILAQEE
jgi:hypothetical protein